MNKPPLMLPPAIESPTLQLLGDMLFFDLITKLLRNGYYDAGNGKIYRFDPSYPSLGEAKDLFKQVTDRIRKTVNSDNG